MTYAAEVSGTYQIYYTHNRAGDFAPPLLLSPGQKPSLAVACDGTVHIAWHEALDSFTARLWYATSADAHTFTMSQLGDYSALDSVSLAIDSAGIAHIAFQARSTGYFFGAIQYIHNAGGAFSSPLIVSPGFNGGVENPEIVLDDTGAVHIAFGGEQQFAGDPVIGYTHNMGGSFVDPITTTNPSVYGMDGVALAVTTGGETHIAFYSFYNLYYTYVESETSLAIPVLVDEGTAPCLHVDSEDTVHFFYASFRHLVADAGPMYMHNREGTFSTPTRLYALSHDTDTYSQRWCALDGNYIHLGFRDYYGRWIMQYLLKDMTLPPVTFPLFEAITDDEDARTDAQPQVAVDAANHAHVAYTSVYPQTGAPDGVASDIMVTHNTSGTFAAPVTVTVAGGYYSKQPALAVDGSAADHVVFMRTAGQLDGAGDIYYTHNRSGTFLTPTLIATDSGQPQIVAHAAGQVRVVYVQDDTYYYTDNLSGTFAAPVALGDASSFGYYSMALDRQEKFHIAWLGADENFYYTHDMSGTLAPTLHISATDAWTDVFSRLSLAIDSESRAHIFFRTSDADADLGYINNTAGDFADLAAGNGLSENSFSPVMAADNLDHLHVIYIGKDNYGGNQIEYLVKREWFESSELVAYGDSYGENRYFAVDGAYQGHLVYLSPINSAYADIFYQRGFVGEFYPITGYVKNAAGVGVGGVVISFTAASGVVMTTTTDSYGYFHQGGYAEVFAVGTYTVSVAAVDTFTPTRHVVDLISAQGIIFVQLPPQADLTATPRSGLAPLTVQFTGTVTGTVTAYTWDFGDGEITHTLQPTHTYANAGNFTVTLTITGPGGTAQAVKPGYITVTAPPPAPVADFTASPLAGAPPLTVVFTDTSTGDITAWQWAFGDGGAATTAHPVHTYQKAGNYTVALHVTGPGGSAVLTRTDYIIIANVTPPHYYIYIPVALRRQGVVRVGAR